MIQKQPVSSSPTCVIPNEVPILTSTTSQPLKQDRIAALEAEIFALRAKKAAFVPKVTPMSQKPKIVKKSKEHIIAAKQPHITVPQGHSPFVTVAPSVLAYQDTPTVQIPTLQPNQSLST